MKRATASPRLQTDIKRPKARCDRPGSAAISCETSAHRPMISGVHGCVLCECATNGGASQHEAAGPLSIDWYVRWYWVTRQASAARSSGVASSQRATNRRRPASVARIRPSLPTPRRVGSPTQR